MLEHKKYKKYMYKDGLFGVEQFGNLPTFKEKQLRKFIVDDEMKIFHSKLCGRRYNPRLASLSLDLNK